MVIRGLVRRVFKIRARRSRGSTSFLRFGYLHNGGLNA